MCLICIVKIFKPLFSVGLTQVPRRNNALDPPRWKINLVPDIGNGYTGGTLDRAKSVVSTEMNNKIVIVTHVYYNKAAKFDDIHIAWCV